jgi:N4-gp56 family major capsid protein
MSTVLSTPTDVAGRLFGDLEVEEAIRLQQDMLPNVTKNLITARFATEHIKNANESAVVRFRRIEKLPFGDEPLSEGTTPNWDSISQRIVTTEMRQFGRYITTTDLMDSFGQLPYQQIITETQATQAAEQMEFLNFKKFRAGTNVFRVNASGASVTNRSQVNGIITTNMIAQAVRKLEEEDCEKITTIVSPSRDIASEPIRASYVAVCHPNLRVDLELLTDFVPVEKYSNASVAFEGEMGAYKGVRFVQSTIYEPFKNAGTTASTSPAMPVLTTAGSTSVDVYPVIIYGANSIGVVRLGGLNSIIPVVHRPDSPSKEDPLNQRGSIGYKYMYGNVILRDEFIMRLEVAVSSL